MKKQLIGLGVAALMFGGVGSAGATIITTGLDSGVSTGYLSQGNYSGTFDIANELLANGGDYNTTYDIASATVNLFFSDDVDMLTHAKYEYAYSRDYYSYSRYRSVSNYYTDEFESVSLGIAQQNLADSTDYFNSGSNYTGTTFDYTGGGWLYSSYYQRVIYVQDGINYYSNNYQVTRGNTGDISMQIALSEENLTTFRETGLVDFDLGISGDINFTSASLTFDIYENSAPVPEPATMLLFGTGLVGLVGSRLRKKKK